MSQPLTDQFMETLRDPTVADAAGVNASVWAARHVLDIDDRVGPANVGRMPYVVVRDLSERYEHLTAAPRGGTRFSRFEVEFHLAAPPARRPSLRRRLSDIQDVFCAALRKGTSFTIGDEQRDAPQRRPYGMVGRLVIDVETSYGVEYDQEGCHDL